MQYTDGAAVKNLSAENNAVVKLYAVWAGQPVQVTVDRNDGSEPTVRTGVVGYNYNYIYENGSARYNQIPDPTRARATSSSAGSTRRRAARRLPTRPSSPTPRP